MMMLPQTSRLARMFAADDCCRLLLNDNRGPVEVTAGAQLLAFIYGDRHRLTAGEP